MLNKTVKVREKFGYDPDADAIVALRLSFIGKVIHEPNGQTGKKRILEIADKDGVVQYVRACDCKVGIK